MAEAGGKAGRDGAEPAAPEADGRFPAPRGESLERSVAAKILTVANLLRRSGNLRYKRLFGMTLTEFRVLSHVGAHAPLSLNQIAYHAGLDKTQMSREVKSLVARGLISRTASKRNMAEAEITLTEAGQALWARMERSARARANDLVGGLDEAELHALSHMLDRLSDTGRSMLQREQEAAHAEGGERPA